MYEHVYVHRDLDDILELFEKERETVLAPATDRASRRAEALVTELQVDLNGFTLGRTVQIETEPVERPEHNVARIPLRWRAQHREGLFPVMDADLEIAAMSHAPRPMCQLSFIGSYTPPMGPVGAAFDAVMGHRIAQESVREFLDEVRMRLERALPAPAASDSMAS